MAELEIDKQDVHSRRKWRSNVNVMKRKSNPIGKRTINRYYIIVIVIQFEKKISEIESQIHRMHNVI